MSRRNRRGPNPTIQALEKRLQTLEDEIATVRREAAEAQARQDDAIELAIAAAVPNPILTLVSDARALGWLVTFRRHPHRDACGTICFENARDSAHDCSIEFPLPSEPEARREIEIKVRMRIGWVHAA